MGILNHPNHKHARRTVRVVYPARPGPIIVNSSLGDAALG